MHFKADRSPVEARQIARILPYIGQAVSGDDGADAHRVGDAIRGLVEGLGLKSTLTEVCGVVISIVERGGFFG